MRVCRAVLAGTLMASLLGCAPEDAAHHVGVTQHAIVDGYEDSVDTAVVGMIHTGVGLLCSGSLIAPNVVLTAQHCVAQTTDDSSGVICDQTGFGKAFSSSGFIVGTEMTIAIDEGGEYGVTQILLPPPVSSSFCGNDIALLILDELVPPAAATPYEPRLDSPLQANELYSAVGFGGTDNAGNGVGTRRRRDELLVTCVGTACDEGGVIDNEWAGNGAVCRGDSGGPAIDENDLVVGVASRGALDCSSSVYSYTAAHAQWLQDSAVMAAGMGQYAPPTWTSGSTLDPEFFLPMGQSCSDGAECPSGRCLIDEGETSGYCSRRCNEDAPCPTDYQCAERDGEQLCQLIPPPPPPQYSRPDGDDCSVERLGAGDAGARGWLWLLALAGLLRLRGRRGPNAPRPATTKRR